MARPDGSTKMAYGLAGAVIGAIFFRVLVLLKRRNARVADYRQMTARLKQITVSER